MLAALDRFRDALTRRVRERMGRSRITIQVMDTDTGQDLVDAILQGTARLQFSDLGPDTSAQRGHDQLWMTESRLRLLRRTLVAQRPATFQVTRREPWLESFRADLDEELLLASLVPNASPSTPNTPSTQLETQRSEAHVQSAVPSRSNQARPVVPRRHQDSGVDKQRYTPAPMPTNSLSPVQNPRSLPFRTSRPSVRTGHRTSSQGPLSTYADLDNIDGVNFRTSSQFTTGNARRGRAASCGLLNPY